MFRVHDRHHYLPPRAVTIINSYLGQTYWFDRERLTWLNVHLDFMNTEWFHSWCTACKWAQWRERHPDNMYVSSTKLCWAVLPRRLRVQLNTRLAGVRLRLEQLNMLLAEERLCGVRYYVGQRDEWQREANHLRKRVHFSLVTR